jgi:hypothetical protein
MPPFKSKFQLIKSSSESNLFKFKSCLKKTYLESLWVDLQKIYMDFVEYDIYLFRFSRELARVQTIVAAITTCFEEYSQPVYDIGIFLYSAIPKKLRIFLGDEIDNFTQSLIYLHTKDASLHKYKEYLSWIDRLGKSMDFETVQSLHPATAEIGKIFVKNYATRLREEKFTDSVPIEGIITADDMDFETSALYHESVHVWYHGRFQSFIFASKPVSYDSVVSMIEGIRTASIFYQKFIASKNGVKKFAAFIFEGFRDHKQFYPPNFLKMVRNVAYVMADNLHIEDPIQHTYFLARWFAPWLELNILEGILSLLPFVTFPSLGKGVEFIQWFKIKHLSLMSDLETRKSPLAEKEIAAFVKVVSERFDKTEMDLTMIDIIFHKNSKKLIDQNQVNRLLFCIQGSIGQRYKIKIPEVQVPKEWVEERDTVNYLYDSSPSLYVEWRAKVMEELLKDKENDLVKLVLGFLRNPIARELELSLDLDSKKPQKSAPKVGVSRLMEIFQYLDEECKFPIAPNCTWVNSKLFKDIQMVIEGISDASEKEKARYAASWKCETFEEYMKIVSLF